MVCKACGRDTVNENANFCEYCGTSYRENIAIGHEDNNVGARVQQKGTQEIENEENEKPISFGNWLGTMVLPFIPFVGIIIYIVMLFVWAFGSDTPKSKKNWARVSLIMGVVGIILFIFVISSTMMDIMNSGLSLEDYMRQLYK